MLWWNHGGWGAGEWLVMILMMVIFWGAVFAVGGWFLRSARGRSEPATGQQRQAGSADEVLADRSARGEIDETEFTRSRELLRTRSGRA